MAYLKGSMDPLHLLDLSRRFNYTLILSVLALASFATNCQSEEAVKKDAMALEHRYFRAIEYGKLNEVEACLAEGLPVDRKDPRGNSGLMHAVDHENFNLVSFLIEKGANVNHRNLVGETALYRAVFRGNLSLVKFLVEKGAEVKIKNIEGISPIHLADERGEETIQNFLEKSKQ